MPRRRRRSPPLDRPRRGDGPPKPRPARSSSYTRSRRTASALTVAFRTTTTTGAPAAGSLTPGGPEEPTPNVSLSLSWLSRISTWRPEAVGERSRRSSASQSGAHSAAQSVAHSSLALAPRGTDLSPRSPPPPLELHVLSSPRRPVPSPLQARGVERTWSREGLNGDRHHSRSTRQQQTRRRSTAWPRAGLQGRRLRRHRRPARATKRRSAGRPAPRSMTRAERAIRNGPRTRAPHEEARSEQPGGRRALGPRANGTGAPERVRGDPRRKAPCRMAESGLAADLSVC
jgi:hypothetical protein